MSVLRCLAWFSRMPRLRCSSRSAWLSCALCGLLLIVSLSSACEPAPTCTPSTCPTPRLCQEQRCVCPSPLQTCQSRCVDLQTDKAHCGGCEKACTTDQSCTQGVCQTTLSCPPLQVACGGLCISTDRDPLHCGACNNACPTGQSCTQGICQSACPAQQTTCDQRCVSLDRDPQHCGACNTPCNTAETCAGGRCVCIPPLQRCDGSCVDITADGRHCGACNNACPNGQFCTNSQCLASCPSATPKVCLGGCINPNENVLHCGDCAKPCGVGLTCVNATCACPPSFSICQDRCVDLQTNPQHCGICNNPCPIGLFCTNGQCTASCPSATPTACLGGCVDTQTNPQHCGACNNTCQASETCTEGVCRCPTGFDRCGTSACLSLETTPQHCGACNNACSANETCQKGRCASSCDSNLTRCAEQCVDTRTDAAHCGACNNTCQNGTTCQGGSCVCSGNLVPCDGNCVDPQIDPQHCGTCGKACRQGRACQQGLCELLVETIAGKLPFADGSATQACFNLPAGLAFDANGNLYVAEMGNHRIRKIDPQGNVTTFAGTSPQGFADGPANQARFNTPTSLAFDNQGNLYVTDRDNHRIRKITPQGNVTTLAGASALGFLNGVGSQARFNRPTSIAFGWQSNLYVTDRDNQRIRQISLSGNVTTIAGDGQIGDRNGGRLTARFNFPVGLAIRNSGGLLVADTFNHRVRSVDDTSVDTLAGSNAGFQNSLALFSQFRSPIGLVMAPQGRISIADFENHRIRNLDNNLVTTFAGDGTADFRNGSANNARFNGPIALALDQANNLYVSDHYNHRIRKIANNNVTTFAGGGCYALANGPAAQAQFNDPYNGVFDANGNLYIADAGNHAIRKLDTNGNLTTIAGTGVSGFLDGPAAQAQFNYPTSLAFDAKGDLFIADRDNHRIRKISNGNVTTISGGGANFANGAAINARYRRPASILFDPNGNLLIADLDNRRIRILDTNGQVSTLAGNGNLGDTDGAALNARFVGPAGLARAPNGNLYIADREGHRIRLLNPSGQVSTLAGDGTAGRRDGNSTISQLNAPTGLALDAQGNLYIADRSNNLIRKLDNNGNLTTFIGTGQQGFFDAPPNQALLHAPTGLAFSPNGNLYIMDRNNNLIRALR